MIQMYVEFRGHLSLQLALVTDFAKRQCSAVLVGLLYGVLVKITLDRKFKRIS